MPCQAQLVLPAPALCTGCAALSHLSIIKLGEFLVEEAVNDQKQLSSHEENQGQDSILSLHHSRDDET